MSISRRGLFGFLSGVGLAAVALPAVAKEVLKEQPKKDFGDILLDNIKGMKDVKTGEKEFTVPAISDNAGNTNYKGYTGPEAGFNEVNTYPPVQTYPLGYDPNNPMTWYPQQYTYWPITSSPYYQYHNYYNGSPWTPVTYYVTSTGYMPATTTNVVYTNNR